MDIHERYNNPTSMDISIFKIIEMTFQKDPSKLFNSMIQFYINKLLNNTMDAKELKTFHLLLRYYYQFVTEYEKSIPLVNASHMYNPKLNLILFQENTSLDVSLLSDVIILHFVLFCGNKNIKEHLINIENTKVRFFTSIHFQSMYMKTMECFLQVQRLKNIHGESLEPNDLLELCDLYLDHIKTWLLLKGNTKWKIFASMLPKLIDTFGINNILFPIWDYVLALTTKIEDLFPALCIMADTCYPIIKECNLFNDDFWFILTQGLKSSIKQHRKQALFLLQRTIEFMGNNKNSTTPFVCKHNESSISNIKRTFFLIFEALEEKQNHLIMPSLTRMPDLIQASNEHKTCGDCFNIKWICCILDRALKHENNTVVKLALFYTCQLNQDAFTDDFLTTFLSTLNNTFLYKCEPNEFEPRIIKQLESLFVRSKENNSNLLEKVFIKLNQISWGPIAMFYVITSIQMATSKLSGSFNWGNTELIAIKLLINGNLNTHSQFLRIGSQIQIFKIIDNCWKSINNLTLLANVLSMFPEDDAFSIDTACWKIIITWMIRVLNKSDIEQFFIQNSNKINSKSFAIIVALLMDAGLIFDNNKCTAAYLIRNYFESLRGIDARPYVDIGSSMNIIKSMSYLLKLRVNNFHQLYEILSPYFPTVIEFLLKSTRKAIESSCHEDLNSYLDIISTLLNSNSNLVDKCLKESMNLLNNEKDTNIFSYLCGLKMLYYCQVVSSSYDNHSFEFINEIMLKSHHGKLVSECYVYLTKLIRLYIVKIPTNQWPKNFHLLSTISDYFDMGGNEIVLSIVQILKLIIDNNLITNQKDINDIKFILARCWKHSFLNKNNHQSCLCIENIVELIFNCHFLALPDTNGLAIEVSEELYPYSFGCEKNKYFSLQYATKLLEDGSNMPVLKNLLIKSINNLNSNDVLNFQKHLFNCLVHGYAYRNDKKIENQTHSYIWKNLKIYYPNYSQSNP